MLSKAGLNIRLKTKAQKNTCTDLIEERSLSRDRSLKKILAAKCLFPHNKINDSTLMQDPIKNKLKEREDSIQHKPNTMPLGPLGGYQCNHTPIPSISCYKGSYSFANI